MLRSFLKERFENIALFEVSFESIAERRNGDYDKYHSRDGEVEIVGHGLMFELLAFGNAVIVPFATPCQKIEPSRLLPHEKQTSISGLFSKSDSLNLSPCCSSIFFTASAIISSGRSLILFIGIDYCIQSTYALYAGERFFDFKHRLTPLLFVDDVAQVVSLCLKSKNLSPAYRA